MTLFARMKAKCQENNTNFKTLERELGFGNGTLRKWEHQCPSYDKVLAVANKLNISVGWLITGKNDAELSPEEQQLVELYRSSNGAGQSIILNTARTTADTLPREQQSSASKIG